MADDIIKEAREAFETIAEREEHNRRPFEEDIDFALLENQWPDTVRKQRELEGRPCLTVSKLGAMIKQVVNDARQNKPGISVHPVDDGSDPETAEVFNGLIRNIEQSSNAEVAYDTALEHAVTGGFGYFRINTQYASDDSFDQDIVIERIVNPLSVYGDCYSTAADSSDWNVCFVTDTLTKTQFEKQYKGAKPVNWADEYGKLSAPWIDGDGVMVAEYWTREETPRKILMLSDGSVVGADEFKANIDLFQALGVTVAGEREVKSTKVVQRLVSGAEELEKIEWAGRYIPIIPVYGHEVYLHGKRHFRSMIRGAKDAQRMFNYWRTTTTELVALAPKAPWVGRKGAFETDAGKWATANTQAHAYLEYDGAEMPQRMPFAGVPAGALQEALNASDDIKSVIGMYDASLGARSNETSGKAIQARQLEGDTSTFNFIDNLNRAIRHAGRVLIDLIPQVYSVPRTVRILGKEGETQMVKVGANVPPEAGEPPGPDGSMQHEGAEVSRIYDLGLGKYDLTVSAGPSFQTQRQEAASQMIELIRAFPEAAPVIGDLLAKNLDWPGADEIAERLKAMLPPAAQGGEGNPEADAVKQQAQQIVQQLGAKLQETQAALEQAKSANDLKAQELQIKAFDAETKRIQVLNKPAEAAKIPAAND